MVPNALARLIRKKIKMIYKEELQRSTDFDDITFVYDYNALEAVPCACVAIHATIAACVKAAFDVDVAGGL